MAEPENTYRTPFAVEVKEGRTYWWCTCGRSRRQPFCDGTHNPTQFLPMKFVAQKTETVWFCGCKRTSTAPLCDGTHNSLKK